MYSLTNKPLISERFALAISNATSLETNAKPRSSRGTVAHSANSILRFSPSTLNSPKRLSAISGLLKVISSQEASRLPFASKILFSSIEK